MDKNDYFSLENAKKYMSVSQFKSFDKCEECTMAELEGGYEREKTTALYVGSYVDSYFEGSLKEFEENPSKIWESNIFGKSLHELVNEGLHNKLYRMPADARMKLQETLERVINEGCSGLICIIL